MLRNACVVDEAVPKVVPDIVRIEIPDTGVGEYPAQEVVFQAFIEPRCCVQEGRILGTRVILITRCCICRAANFTCDPYRVVIVPGSGIYLGVLIPVQWG